MATSSTSFKGNKPGPGRPPGATNKVTRTAKELFSEVLSELQKDRKANLKTWAKKNPGAFYTIAARLIPMEVKGTVKKIYVVTDTTK